MTKVLILLSSFLLFVNISCSPKGILLNRPIVNFATSYGSFKIAFYKDTYNPNVERIVSLVSAKEYVSTYFHKASPLFYIQGGDPNTKNSDASDDGAGGESFIAGSIKRLPLRAGDVAFVSNGGNAFNTHQFVIFLKELSSQQRSEYSDNIIVFARVIEGIDVVKKISLLPDIKRCEVIIKDSSVVR